MLKPYEYNRVKYLTFELINIYHSVNDASGREASYSLVYNELIGLLDSPKMKIYLDYLKDMSLTSEKAEQLLLDLKTEVSPFPLPSESEIKKSFKKVKKFKIPALSLWDMRDVSYLAWNETSSNRKYILTADGRAFYGTMSGELKNICAICRKTSIVTQFLATTKTGPEGTYTKNGTYICRDSDNCNRQIQSELGLKQFLEIIKTK